MNKLVGAKLVGIIFMAGWRACGLHTLPEISSTRAVGSRTNSVAPIIAVSKASARKTNHRRLDLLHLVDQLFPNATDVRNLRVFSNPDAIVDDSAQVFREVPVNVRRDNSQRFVKQNLDS